MAEGVWSFILYRRAGERCILKSIRMSEAPGGQGRFEGHQERMERLWEDGCGFVTTTKSHELSWNNKNPLNGISLIPAIVVTMVLSSML